jgi:hypothetical protein
MQTTCQLPRHSTQKARPVPLARGTADAPGPHGRQTTMVPCKMKYILCGCVSHCHPVACRSQHMAAASAAEVSEDAGRDPFVQEHQPTPTPMVLTQTQTQSPFSLYHSHELTCRRPAITSRMICRHVSSRRFDSLRGRLVVRRKGFFILIKKLII